jgi:hypothetical protein
MISVVDSHRSLEWLKHTFKLESEIVSEMPAFMIATEKKEGVGIPDLEGP